MGSHGLDEVVGVLAEKGSGGTHPWGYGTYGVFTENCLQPGRWAVRCTGRHRTHAEEGWPCLSYRLDQEPLSIRKKGRLREARGPAVCPWWEAPEGQGWQQGVHRGRRS